MRKWERYVRDHLGLPEMKQHREERIIRELADHLEDLYQETLARGIGEAEAEELVLRRVGDLDVAAAELARNDGPDLGPKADRWFEGKEHRFRGKGGSWTWGSSLPTGSPS